VRLREEQANAPEGWLERWRSRLLFNTGRSFRPAVAGALAVVLLVGGGTFAGFHFTGGQTSATVNDLQIFDKNDQAIHTMDLLDEPSNDDGSVAGPSS
jgi:hypothetical protein